LLFGEEPDENEGDEFCSSCGRVVMPCVWRDLLLGRSMLCLNVWRQEKLIKTSIFFCERFKKFSNALRKCKQAKPIMWRKGTIN
jgi:hypothetical protein